MLDKSPVTRLSNLSQIKNYKYFKNFSFENLINFNIKPSFKPKVNNNILNEPVKMKYIEYINKNFRSISVGSSIDEANANNEGKNNWYDEF